MTQTSHSESESDLQNRIRLAVSRHDVCIFRNNVGLFRTQDGRMVKTGLCKGSSDLIGWTTVTIRPQDVGRKVAVFTGLEVKLPRGRATDEQLNFVRVVRESGGIGGIVKSVDDAIGLIKDW